MIRSLEQQAKDIAQTFAVSDQVLNMSVKHFQDEMNEGLASDGTELSQIPTFVTKVPDGSETGVCLAVDVGGTNLRVFSATLHGDSTYSLDDEHIGIPNNLKIAAHARDLFAFIALRVKRFLEHHHPVQLEANISSSSAEHVFNLGFAFSFPTSQTALNRGVLLRWTKGFRIDDAVGQDVCMLLQEAMDALKLPIKVSALVNDSTGTLVARCYTNPHHADTLIGAIFGTGTNGAYIERLSRIRKLPTHQSATTGEMMIVNTEWGSFDNALEVLPTTIYDTALDKQSLNPGYQALEKRISGMFLGEILRLVVLELHNENEQRVFCPSKLEPECALMTPYSVDASALSFVEADSSLDLVDTADVLATFFNVTDPTMPERVALKTIVHAIGNRAIRLSAVPLAAILLSSNLLGKKGIVDIGADGSLIEHYPGFTKQLLKVLQIVEGIGPDRAAKITMSLCKDGSGLGAALAARFGGPEGLEN